MKTTSMTTLAIAMLLCATSLSMGQTTTGTVTGTTGTTVDAAGAAVTGNAGVTAGASVDGTVDANVSGEVDMTLDVNGDGAVDEEEAAAGVAAAAGLEASSDCGTVDLQAAGEDAQADAIAAATSAQVLRLSNCDSDTASSLSADALEALTENAAINMVLGQENVSAGEILAVSVDETAATIYVRDDDDGEDDAAAVTAQ